MLVLVLLSSPEPRSFVVRAGLRALIHLTSPDFTYDKPMLAGASRSSASPT